MCGIAGQIALNAARAVDMGDVHRMVRALVHRGPDGEGFFVDPARRVAFGIRRLAVIDLVSGDQPLFNEDGTVVCVLNGEIYNYRALRAEMERRGHAFKTHSDTEVLVHLYEEHGVQLVQRLRGMFAFALWDDVRQVLLLARDRVGKKPLYYLEREGRLSFASEASPLYDVPGFQREIDPVALHVYLTYGYIPAPLAIFREVRKLPPAHIAVVRQGRIELERYWKIETVTPFAGTAEEAVRAVRASLEESVALRLESDVPLGCFLSGGADSSSIVALMSRLSSTRVRTFSIGFDSERFNELGYARDVAKRLGTEHQEYIVQPDAATVIPQMVRHFGEPFGDASALPTWYVSQLARRDVTVALNGDGGDEAFGGYTWYRTALSLDRFQRAVPAWTRPMLARSSAFLGPRAARLGHRLAMTPANRFASLRMLIDPETRRGLYGPALLDHQALPADGYLTQYYEDAPGDALACLQRLDIRTYLPEDLLVKVDRMTMAHGLEARSPLLDHELLELATALPAHLKVRDGTTKWVLRAAMADLLPAETFTRPKMGFSVPIGEWLRGPLREECESQLLDPSFSDRGWLKPHAVRALLIEHQAGRTDHGAALWVLLMLAQWARVFLP